MGGQFSVVLGPISPTPLVRSLLSGGPPGRGAGWYWLHKRGKDMSRPRLLGRASVAVLGATVMLPAIAVGTGSTAIQAAAGGTTRQISAAGTVFMSGPAQGSDTLQKPEIRTQASSDNGAPPFKGSIIDAATNGAGNQLSSSNA